MLLQTPGLSHGGLEGILDDDDRGAGGLFFIPGISREEAQASAMAIGAPGVFLELQVDIPEPPLVADGGEMLP